MIITVSYRYNKILSVQLFNLLALFQCNRYPLHYAYALKEQDGKPFIRLLMEKNPDDIEHKTDKVRETRMMKTKR